MEMSVLQIIGLLVSISVTGFGVIRWLVSRIEKGDESTKTDLRLLITSNSAKIDLMSTALSDVRVNYANKQELTAVVQMFQNSIDRQSADTNRAIDGITTRIDNLINIVTRQHNGN